MTPASLEWCLFAAVLGAIYPIVGYPLALGLLAVIRPRPVRRGRFTPTVSILIPAYNEAACIAATVENKLTQDYPGDLVEVIVVSDASDDGTDAVVESFADRGVTLLRRPVRRGKAAALNEAVLHARGEIIVFSDANSQFALDAVRLLVENFADSQVGYVTGSLEYVHAGETSGRGSGAYMRYENWLRRLESRVGSIIGVNGGVDAMRRALYRPVAADQITDFVLPLRVIAAGYRVVFDERARSAEAANTELTSEFRMRVRVALRALRGLAHVPEALSVVRSPLAAFCIVSHKVLRYSTFAFLAAALILNGMLSGRSHLLATLMVLQLVFYGVALVGMARALPKVVRRVTSLPAYFLLSNIAFGIAALRFVRGDAMTTWKPRAG